LLGKNSFVIVSLPFVIVLSFGGYTVKVDLFVSDLWDLRQREFVNLVDLIGLGVEFLSKFFDVDESVYVSSLGIEFVCNVLESHEDLVSLEWECLIDHLVIGLNSGHVGLSLSHTLTSLKKLNLTVHVD